MKASNQKEDINNNFFNDDDDDENDQKGITARDEGMQLKMKNLLQTLYEDVTKKNKQKAQRTLQQFTNLYSKYEIAFKSNTYPRSLFKISVDISNAFVETSNKVKQFVKLMNDWNNFINKFKSEIDLAQNLESDKDDDEYEDEDEDELNLKTKNSKKARRKKSSDNVIIGKRLIHKCETAREKGQKPTISVSKLYETAKAINKDSEVRNDLINEAIRGLTETTEKDPLLTKGQWEVAFGVIDLCKENPDCVIPILNRLTAEIVQRPRSTQRDFPETDEILKMKSKLIEIIQYEINQLNDSADDHCFKLYNLLCQIYNLSSNDTDINIYNNSKFVDIVINMFDSLEKTKISINSTVKSSLLDAVLLLVISLASQNHSENAASIFDLIPKISSSTNSNLQVIYAARSCAEIGQSAFNSRHYKLASKFLSQFDKVSKIPKLIGQNPIFDKTWPIYDANKISIFRQISDELIKIQDNFNQLNSEKNLQSTFSNHFQNLQNILNKSAELNLKIPDQCEKDIKDVIALTFSVSSSNQSINDVSTKYLLDNFSIQSEQFQIAFENAQKIKQGDTFQFDFFKDVPSSESSNELSENIKKIVAFIHKYVC